MQMPANNASSAVYLVYASHVEGAVEAWKDAETITPEEQAAITQVGLMIQPAVADLRAKEAAVEEAGRAVSRARARFGVRDVLLDRGVMATSDGLLNGPARRNREHAIYKQVFRGTNPSEITRARIREEPELVDRLRERLASAPPFAAQAGMIAGLDEVLEKSVAARKALDDAGVAEAKAVDAEATARLALRQAFEQAYGMLRTAFPGQRDFVESFFPRQRASSAADAEQGTDDAPAEAPATPPAAQPTVG